MRTPKKPCHCGKPSRAEGLCTRHLRLHREALPVFEVVDSEAVRLERLRESNGRFLAFLDRVYAEE